MNMMPRIAWIALLAGCAGPAGRPEGALPLGRPIEPLWTADATPDRAERLFLSPVAFPPTLRRTPVDPPHRMPVALPWGAVLFADGGALVCADGRTGRALWTADADPGVQAAACREQIVVLDRDGTLRSLSREGREAWRRGAEERAILFAAPDRVYTLTPASVAAYDPATLQRAWEWRPHHSLRFLSLVADGGRVAVEYYSEDLHHHEIAILEHSTGRVKHRFLGRALGWHGDTFFVLRDWTRELWGWGPDGAFRESRRVDSWDGRAAFLHAGRLIHSGVNRYYTDAKVRIGPDGAVEVPPQVESRREIQREGAWQAPLEGEARLIGDIVFDATRERLVGRLAAGGEPLWEVRAPIANFDAGPRGLFVLTTDGRLLAYRR